MFKKFISIMMVILMVASTVAIAAKPGDIAGNYYYTDIKTYLRGQLLDSYNVGGKTVIVAEALKDYGFVVGWDGNARQLTITDMKRKAQSTAIGGPQGTVGAVAGTYYHTDIVTIFNEVKVESYNLGGITVIPANALKDLGYKVEWDEANRQVLIDTVGSVATNPVISNTTVKPTQVYHGNYVLRAEAPNFNGKRLVTSKDIMIETSVDQKTYVPFKAFADCMGIAYSWNSGTSTITVSVPSDSQLVAQKTTYAPVFKTYGNIEYEIKDIILYIENNGVKKEVDAIIYGNEVMVDGSSLGPALGMFCVNRCDFYTTTAMYYLFTNGTVSVTGVQLNTTTATLTTGQTIQLTSTIYPTNAMNKGVTWTSNKTSVATVSASGLVTAVGTGTANIVVRTNDGGKTAVCIVTVN